jgi:hypothetical protein
MNDMPSWNSITGCRAPVMTMSPLPSTSVGRTYGVGADVARCAKLETEPRSPASGGITVTAAAAHNGTTRHGTPAHLLNASNSEMWVAAISSTVR